MEVHTQLRGGLSIDVSIGIESLWLGGTLHAWTQLDHFVDKISVLGVHLIMLMMLMNYVTNLYATCECLNLLWCSSRNNSISILVGLTQVSCEGKGQKLSNI